MRIVVRNIENLQESQVQQILREWIPASTDPACYFASSGSYYANVSNEVLKTLAADFNARLKPQLGRDSCIQVALVQELPATPKSKKLTGGIKSDETFQLYQRQPETWRLDQVKRKQKKGNKPKNAQLSSSAGPSNGSPGVLAKPPDRTDDKKKKKKKVKPKPKGESKSDTSGDVTTESKGKPKSQPKNQHKGEVKAGTKATAKSTAKDTKPESIKPPKPESSRAKPSRSEASKPEASRSEASKPEASKPEASRSEASKSEAGKLESKSSPKPKKKPKESRKKPQPGAQSGDSQAPSKAPIPEKA